MNKDQIAILYPEFTALDSLDPHPQSVGHGVEPCVTNA
jgi:hypothetical protein